MKSNFFHWLKMPTYDGKTHFVLVVSWFSYGWAVGAQLGMTQSLAWRTTRITRPVLCLKGKLFQIWPHLLPTLLKRSRWDNSCVWHSQKEDRQAHELVPLTPQPYWRKPRKTKIREAQRVANSQTWLPSLWMGHADGLVSLAVYICTRQTRDNFWSCQGSLYNWSITADKQQEQHVIVMLILSNRWVQPHGVD